MKRFLKQIPAILAFLIPFCLFASVNGRAGTWLCQPKMDIAMLAGAAVAGVAASLFFAWFQRRYNREANPIDPGMLWIGLAFCVALATLTTYTENREFHFLRWPFVSSPLRYNLYSRKFQYVALTAAFMALLGLSRRRKWIDWFLPCLFVAGELVCAWAMWDLTRGVSLYVDDHPSFLFRIQEFWHSFPWRENYVPYWNGGVVNSVISSSGTAGYAILTAPLHAIFGAPHLYHSFGMVLVFAFVVPWAMVWALREDGHGWCCAWAGALLALFSHRVFFQWTFSYGTVGAGVAFAFLPIAFVFLHAVAARGRTAPSAVAGLALSMALMCQWAPMWLAAVFLLLAALSSCGRWFREPRVFVALCVAAVVVALLLLPTFVSVAGGKDLVSFTTENSCRFARSAASYFRAWRDTVADLALRVHPLVMVLGLGGMWIIPDRSQRAWLAIVSVGLMLIFVFGPYFAPNMQLFRMYIGLGLLAAVPAAIWTARLLGTDHSALLPLQGALLALLVVGAINMGDLYHGRGSNAFMPMRGFLPDFAAWVGANVPEGSRLLFADETMHHYGKGHVAYLPLLAGREMMSCDYYAFPEYDPEYPKAAHGGSAEELHDFLVRNGVSHVVAKCDEEAASYRGHPEFFDEVDSFKREVGAGRFSMFAVRESRGVVLEGEGSVRADFNRIHVEFSSGCERMVIAYNWNERMEVAAPATIAPFETGFGESFIEVTANGTTSAEIRYRPRF